MSVSHLVLLSTFSLVLAGGAYVHASLRSVPPAPPAPPAPRAPVVMVMKPAVRRLVEHVEAIGRTAAIETVQVRARVSGHLDRIHFREGVELNRGAPLFDIDARPYRIQLAQAEANVRAARARLATQTLDLSRLKVLATGGYTSRQSLDQLAGSKAEVTGSLDALVAAVDRARLDLEFTRLTAPVAGRVGRALVTAGNLVEAGATVLTTIVRVDEMHVFFELDERTAAAARRHGMGVGTPVELGLTGEDGFPHRGTVDYVDITVDPGTATLALRARFDNSKRVLAPGMFGRVRLPKGAPQDVLQVPEVALGADQSGPYVKVVGADGTVERRGVVTVRAEAGMVAIRSGLTAADRVIVRGLQRARTGTRVQAELEGERVR